MKIRNLKSKCACYAGGIGICLCIVFMSIGVAGITVVGLSKNDNIGGGSMGMASMGTMSGSSNTIPPSTFQNMVISFFSGFWGEVVLLISFVSMIAGMWFSTSNNNNNRKVIPISITGSVILYVSMYTYYSIALEIAGIVILVFAYVTIYSNRVAKIAKLI